MKRPVQPVEHENLKFWNAHRTPDPDAVSRQEHGARLSAINPLYLVRCATEAWGPMGGKWGAIILGDRYVEGAPVRDGDQIIGKELLHVCQVRLWYTDEDGNRCEVEQFGQTLVVKRGGRGGAQTDEDAPKKSFTDGLSKCLSLLGFAADVYLGLWDDSKYVDSVKEALRSEPPERVSAGEVALERERLKNEKKARGKRVEHPFLKIARNEAPEGLHVMTIVHVKEERGAHGPTAAWLRLVDPDEKFGVVDRIDLVDQRRMKILLKALGKEHHGEGVCRPRGRVSELQFGFDPKEWKETVVAVDLEKADVEFWKWSAMRVAFGGYLSPEDYEKKIAKDAKDEYSAELDEKFAKR